MKLVKKFRHNLSNFGFSYALMKAIRYVQAKLGAKLAYLWQHRLIMQDLPKHLPANAPAILLFSHDLSRTGAPMLLLDIARILAEKHKYNIVLLCLCSGELYEDFAKIAVVVNLRQTQLTHITNTEHVQKVFSHLHQLGISKAILNTFCGGLFIPFLERHRIDYQILVHELPGVIEILHWHRSVVGLLAHMSRRGKLVFSSRYTYDQVVARYSLTIDKYVYAQGCKLIDKALPQPTTSLHQLLHLPTTAKIVLGCGKGVTRKGVDLFCDIAQKVAAINSAIYFIWIGDFADAELHRIKNTDISSNLKFINFSHDYLDLVRSADLFILTSREDPLPNILLEMLCLGIPSLAYKDCGGYVDLLQQIDGQLLIDKFDNQAYAKRIVQLLATDNQSLYHEIARKAKQLINRDYKMSDYVDSLLDLFAIKPSRVSVIIPNYNYARFLPQRISSIVNQSLLPYEIIFLDDCSSDESLVVAENLLSQCGIKYQIVKNERNMGVYNQWRKGISLASGDYIWIAEADDFCKPDFLEILNDKFYLDSGINLVYCQSAIINESDEMTQPHTLAHTHDLSATQWSADFCLLGEELATRYGFYRNVIVNVSSCIFRRDRALDYIDFEYLAQNFRYCGDWYFYASLMRYGKVYYVSQVLNMFRKHSSGVTVSKSHSPDYLLELVKIREFMLNTFALDDIAIQKAQQYTIQDYNFDNELVAKSFASLRVPTSKIPIMLISTNPSAVTGGGSEILWQETALKMQRSGEYQVAICLDHRGLLADKLPRLLAHGITIFYKNEVATTCIDTFQPRLVVISQGDHNEGIDWGNASKQAGISYVILNQLVKEGWWIDDSLSTRLRDFYLNAAKVFFTCNNNRLLLERQIAAKLNNSAIHYNPLVVSAETVVPYPSYEEYYSLACPGRYTVIHKGQDLLFALMQTKKWRERNLIINLYGDGENKQQLEQLRKYYNLDNIVIHGYKKDILSMWQSNHGIIMPSRFEGLPIVLLTAMLCARMPIVTNVGGHAELIEHGLSGFIAPFSTVNALDEALESAWQVRQNWQEFGNKARARVLDFMPQDPINDFINKLKDVILC